MLLDGHDPHIPIDVANKALEKKKRLNNLQVGSFGKHSSPSPCDEYLFCNLKVSSNVLTLSHNTNFRLFQPERVSR